MDRDDAEARRQALLAERRGLLVQINGHMETHHPAKSPTIAAALARIDEINKRLTVSDDLDRLLAPRPGDPVPRRRAVTGIHSGKRRRR